MENISNNDVIDLYANKMKLTQYSFIKNGRIRNIYDILGIRPKVDDNGVREITPYEILQVPPQMEMGREIPIVFAIKNTVKKIGKYDGNEYVYTYQSKKVKTEASLLQTLKTNYKKAVFEGDEEQAYRILQMYDKVSGGKAREFLESFYDYTKFYRRMRKQLLIDLFAHFFLMQMEGEKPKVKSAKLGVMRKNRNLRPFRNRSYDYDSSGYNAEQVIETAQKAEINMLSQNRNQKYIDPWTFTFFGRKKSKVNSIVHIKRRHMRRYDWIAESLGFGNKKKDNKFNKKLGDVQNKDNKSPEQKNIAGVITPPANQTKKSGSLQNTNLQKRQVPEIQRGISFDR